MDGHTSLLMNKFCNTCKYFSVYRECEPCKSCKITNYEPVIDNLDKIPSYIIDDMMDEPAIRNYRLEIREKMIELSKKKESTMV